MNAPLPPRMRDVTKLVDSAGTIPQPDNSLFQRMIVEDLAGGGTRTTVIGLHVVLDASSSLYQSLHKPNETKATAAQGAARDEVLFLCDRLVINAPLTMPCRDVIIHARHLLVGSEGKLDLSAPNYETQAANAHGTTPGADGLPGWTAGTLRLYVKEFKSSGAARPLFLAIGGNGQVPGKGAIGVKGNSVPYKDNVDVFLQRGAFSSDVTKNHKFDYPAVGYELRFDQPLQFLTSTYHTNNGGKWEKKFSNPNDHLIPTSGTDAVAAGKPGEPGNAGAIYSNLTSAIREFCVQNGGQPGTLANRDPAMGQDGYYAGGAAGTPDHFAFHMVEVKLSGWDSDIIGLKTLATFNEGRVQAGNRAQGLIPPNRTKGDQGPLVQDGSTHYWVHPILVRTIIDYVREVYLAGGWSSARDILTIYNEALNACCRNGAVTTGDYRPWLSTTTESLGGLTAEVAGLLSALDRNRDYFGNLAGHIPLLSLQATAAKFDLDIDVALRTMLLADWVADINDKNTGTAAAMNWASDHAAKERQRAEGLIKQADEEIVEANKSLNLLKMRIDAETEKVTKLENRLRVEATDEAETKARIALLGKIAGAACAVIPYGQPILGAAGGIVSDLTSWDMSVKEFPVDGLKEASKTIGDQIKEYREKEKAEREKKEQETKKTEDELSKALDANLEAGKSRSRSLPLLRAPASVETANLKEKADAANKARETTLKRWQHVGENVGKATGLIQKGLAGLTVPQSTIEAGMAQLKAASPEWAALAKSIEALNREKVATVRKLTDAVEMFAQATAILSTTTASIAAFDRAKSNAISLVNPDAVQALRKMKSAARMTVARTLYNLAKSYEAQVFKPAPIDWTVLQVYDYVKRTLAPDDKQGLSWAVLSSTDTIAMLKTLFDKQKQTIWAALEANGELPLSLRYDTPLTLSATQTPHEMADLNGPDRRVVMDPFELRLITPTKERQWLIDVDLVEERLKFDLPEMPGGARIVEITLRGGQQGIVRCGLEHFGVSSAGGRHWSWRYDTLTGELTKASRDTTITDAFTTFFPHTANLERSRRQKLEGLLSGAPLWTDLTVELRSDGQDLGVLPNLVQLEFRLDIQAVKTNSLADFTVIRSICADGAAGILLTNDGGETNPAMRGHFQSFLQKTGKPILVQQVPKAKTTLAAVRVLSSTQKTPPAWQPLPVELPGLGDDYLIECETHDQQRQRLALEAVAVHPVALVEQTQAAAAAAMVMHEVTLETGLSVQAPLFPLIYDAPDDGAAIIGVISDTVEPDTQAVPDVDNWFFVDSEGIVGYAKRLDTAGAA